MKKLISLILHIWIRNRKLFICSIRIGSTRRDGVSSVVSQFVESVASLRNMPFQVDSTKEKEKEKAKEKEGQDVPYSICLLYTSPSPRDVEESRMPSSA